MSWPQEQNERARQEDKLEPLPKAKSQLSQQMTKKQIDCRIL